MAMQVIFHHYAVVQLNRPDILYDVPKMLLSSYGPLALEMELYSKNASLDFQIFKKL